MSNSTKRPNIVFLFADDWGKYASAYASIEGTQSVNGLIHTPNFDRIATEGALFTNAFVPAPSCTPCRSSILSGTYFFKNMSRSGSGRISYCDFLSAGPATKRPNNRVSK